MTELGAGTTFAGYVVEGVVGRGGMSVLYRAIDPTLNRPVALKVIASDLSEDETFRRRFTEEAHLAASIDHPNVVPIYGFGEEGGRLYIAMRLVPGRDLRKLIAEDDPLDLARIADLLGQVAAALDSVHASGMVHRDIKPDNILVTPPGPPDDREHAYLSDFGLTRSDTRSRLTQAGQIVGTLAYASPEQLQDDAITTASDIYSLGCVVFEMVTGLRPFPRTSDAAVIYAHLQDPPPAVASLRADVPPAIDAVVATAMAKHPDDRYRSASDLYRAFCVAIGPAGADPTRQVPATPAGLPSTTPSPTVASQPAATTSAPGQATVLTPPPVSLGTTTDTASGVRPPRTAWAIGAAALVLVVALLATALVLRRGDQGVGAAAGSTGPTGAGATASTPAPALVVEGTPVPVSTDPPVSLQTRLSAEDGGKKLVVDLVFRNLSGDWVHVGWWSSPPPSLAELGIDVQAPGRCAGGAGTVCQAMAAEFDQGPKTESRYRYVAKLATPATSREVLDVWLTQFDRLGGSGQFNTQDPVTTVPSLPRTDGPTGTITRCTVVGTDGDDTIEVPRDQLPATVCALGGDDVIVAPALSAQPPPGGIDPSVALANGWPTECVTVHGGDGRDVVSFEATTATGVEAALERRSAASRTTDGSSAFALFAPCNPAAPTLVGFHGVEVLRGSSRNDVMSAFAEQTGVAGPWDAGTENSGVALEGGAGDDQLAGSTVAERIEGGDGTDQCFTDRGATVAACEDAGPTPPFLPPAPPNT